MSQDSPKNQNEQDLEKLAYMIMKAEKSHNLPSASWRHGKAGDGIQSESTGLRTRGTEGIQSSQVQEM